MTIPKQTFSSCSVLVDPPNPAWPEGYAAGGSSSADEPINILLVDDEPRNLVVLQTVLAAPGYRLVCAESAEQALMALVSEEFALLVLDVHMPGMSGFELAQLIKQRQKTAGVPIIFLTAYYSEDEHVLEGYGSGAVDYLHKPINPTILRSKVAVFADLYLKGRQTAQANRDLLVEVAARRRAEEELRRLNDELERRVTERTASLQLRERELASLADNTPDILTRFDRDLRFVFINAAIESATGRLRSAYPGHAIREVGLPDDLCELWEQAIRNVFASARRHSFEFALDGPRGVRHYATRLVPEPGPVGEPGFVLGITQDVTDRKRAEEALKRADRRKDEFLATLSHELRNPLAPIRTGLHLLRTTRDPEVEVQMRDMLDRQFAHMVRLVEDLLNISRVTSDKLRLKKEPVRLQAIVEGAVEDSRPVIEAAGHVLNLDLPREPIALNADPTRLSQVITNLLTNAAKYTPRGGAIELSAASTGHEVAIRVKDTGMGLPPEMLGEVFEMFTQVNRTLERSQDGLGIGLALARRLIELHGGSITAESPGLGQGSTFTVRLPVAGVEGERLAPTATPATETVPRPIRGRKILIVDDNVDGAECLAKVLQLGGHAAQTAHSGPEALDLARPFGPELVFLDIGLPGMDGYEVARRFRDDPALHRTVLIALTGWGTEDDKRQSRAAGFDFHLTKPVEVGAIEDLLARLPAPRG